MRVGSKKKHIVRAIISKVIHIEEDVPVKLLLTDEEKQEFDSMSTQEQAMWVRSKGALPFEDILGDEDTERLEELLSQSEDPLIGSMYLETVIGDVVGESIEVSEWDGVEGTIEEFKEQLEGMAIFTGSELDLIDDLTDPEDSAEMFKHYLESLMPQTDVNEPITLQNTEFTEEELSNYLDTISQRKGE